MERSELAQIIFRMATRESWNTSKHIGRVFVDEVNNALSTQLTNKDMAGLLKEFYSKYDMVVWNDNIVFIDLKTEKTLRILKRNERIETEQQHNITT